MKQFEQDYAGWAEDTALAISEGRWEDIDREALADEVSELSNSSRREVESALRIVLIHLLKIKHQPLRHTRSWDLTISEHRARITRFFLESPSLRGKQIAILEAAYSDARYRAASETGLPLESFTEICPWNFTEVMGGEAKN